MFDSLKEESPVKKAAPSKRKLGPKTAEVKKTAKRIKKRPVSDDSSEDDFTSKKVSEIRYNFGFQIIEYFYLVKIT